MKHVVVGDIHGCVEELDELLYRSGYQHGKDDLVLLGDLIDRGPDPKGVIDRAMELGARVVMGNHEEKAIRWRKHEGLKIITPMYKNPMRVAHSRIEEWKTFSEKNWEFLEKLPLSLHVGARWAAVHAGVRNGLPIRNQFQNELLRLRYIRKIDGKMAQLSEDISDLTHTYWTELWGGPESIVYGHRVYEEGPRMTELHTETGVVRTAGIDTGCCFGGTLTAMVLEVPQYDAREATTTFVSVKAFKRYCEHLVPTE